MSYLLYDKHGVVLFALKVVDLEHDNLTRIFLNPADYRIPPKEKFTVEAFVMAKNKADSDLSNDRFKKSSGPSSMPGTVFVFLLLNSYFPLTSMWLCRLGWGFQNIRQDAKQISRACQVDVSRSSNSSDARWERRCGSCCE